MSVYTAHCKTAPGIVARSFGGEVPFRPFLQIDLFDMNRDVFPPHRHDGVSVLTYLLPESETGMRNRDDIGNDLVIEPGALHWTTAGAGIVHHEAPTDAGRRAIGFQIFVDLPAGTHDRRPGILDVAASDVPSSVLGGVNARCVLGTFGDLRSPLQPPVAIGIADLDIPAHGSIDLILPGMADAFVFVERGSATVAGDKVDAGEMIRATLDGEPPVIDVGALGARAFVFSTPLAGAAT